MWTCFLCSECGFPFSTFIHLFHFIHSIQVIPLPSISFWPFHYYYHLGPSIPPTFPFSLLSTIQSTRCFRTPGSFELRGFSADGPDSRA